MIGSPNKGASRHPAEYILDAPTPLVNADDISVYTFEEYFNRYKENFKIAIRRQWIGQSSNSEHKRAVGLARKVGNTPWIYDGAAGEPNSGWRADFPANNRKTVYFLMIEKVR